jgi:peptide/nickel transport system substrate-binding protein
MMSKLTRREFIRISALGAAGAAAAACAPQTVVVKETVEVEVEKVVKETVEVEVEKVVKETVIVQPSPEPTPTPIPEAMFDEAPVLAEMVSAGSLPPVDERVGPEALVVQMNESLGQYGGTWHMGSTGAGDRALTGRTAGYENPLRWDKTYTKVEPNMVTTWEASPDGKEFTLFLRKGIKWSDGTLLTADDYIFTFYDRVKNKELVPTFPDALLVGGAEPEMEKLDDYTVKMVFAAPSGGFTIYLADVNCNLQPLPAEYNKQFHPDYAEKAELDAKIADAGYDNWWELFGLMNQGYTCCTGVPGRPTQYGWAIDDTPWGDAPQSSWERNPYFWKVDPEGSQLPYIDRLFYKFHESRDTILMDAIAGEIDMQKRHLDIMENIPVLREHMDDGGYHFFRLQRGKMNAVILHINQNLDEDPWWSELAQKMDFRIALSHAIDRQEIIDVVYAGQSEPFQTAPLPNSPFYNETLAKQYTEYDPDTANEMLDELLPDKDADGFRLRDDTGERLSIVAETAAEFKRDWADSLEIIAEQWKRVGLELKIKTHERAFYQGQRHELGLCMISVWEGDISYWGVAQLIRMAPCYHNWTTWLLSGGESGEEPPEVYVQMQALEDELKMTVDFEKQKELITQIQELYPFTRIGVCTIPPGFGVVKNNFHNVSALIPDMWIGATPGLDNTCQYWIGQA